MVEQARTGCTPEELMFRVLDAYSRRVAGWSMVTHLRTEPADVIGRQESRPCLVGLGRTQL
jgi:hypothetical protein